MLSGENGKGDPFFWGGGNGNHAIFLFVSRNLAHFGNQTMSNRWVILKEFARKNSALFGLVCFVG